MKQQHKPGTSVSQVLRHSWQANCTETTDTPQLRVALPLLRLSASAGLAWWGLRHSDLASTAEGASCAEAFRYQTLLAAAHAVAVRRNVRALQDAGIEALLIKGWAVVRRYPAPGLRPSGDVDLCVAPADLAAARTALAPSQAQWRAVDLHAGVPDLEDRPLAELFRRSQVVALDGIPVRILGEEEQLRLLCVHFFRHGAWRPLGLCDIALLAEAAGPDFDWNYCLAGNRWRADAVRCCLRLAEELLGADLAHLPAQTRLAALPRWMAPAVLRSWGRPHRLVRPLDRHLLHRPAAAARALADRWSNPVEVTAHWRVPLNDLPRRPFQLAYFIQRGLGMMPRRLGWLS